MVTAYAEFETAVNALHEGAYDYLRKPFIPRDLLATLNRCFEKIRLEREKDIAVETLRTSEEQYRMLVETMADGLAVQDGNGTITFVNNGICAMLGYSRDEMIGHSALSFLDETNRNI